MQQLELTPERSAELEKLQLEYSVFISADYMTATLGLVSTTIKNILHDEASL